MATLFELIRSFETRTTFAQQLGDYLSHQDLGRTAEQYTRHFKRILDTAAAAAKTIFESNQRFAQLCIEFKWPPPWHIPASLADQITNTYHAGKLPPRRDRRDFRLVLYARGNLEFRKAMGTLWLARAPASVPSGSLGQPYQRSVYQCRVRAAAADRGLAA